MSPDSSDVPRAPTPLSRFRERGGALSAYKQVDKLISAPDPAATVGALSVPELFGLVRGVGFADALDLIALATPAQIRGCIDLDAWDRDRFSDASVQPWLAALVEAGFAKLGEVWAELDPELAALVIKRWSDVYDLTQDEAPPEDSERPVITTPDTFFALEITAERDDEARLVHQLVEDLYRADQSLARHTIMSARSEPTTELEELSYRWRTGRMADLGYVDFYEALEVFRPLDAAQVAIGEQTADAFAPAETGDEARVGTALPIELADAVVGPSFLARALATVREPEEASRLETALLYLINRVLSASRVSPGDTDAAKAGAELTAATLSLGLEHVSAGDVNRAGEALRTVSLTRVHRVGFTTTLRLARLARSLAPRAAVASDDDRALVAALVAARPWFPRELDTPRASGWRPFASLADVRIVATALTDLALRIAIVEQALGVDLVHASAQPEPRPELDDYARTALARAAQGGEPTPAPMSQAELAAAKERTPAERARAASALRARLDEAGVSAGGEQLGPVLERWLRQLDDALAAVPEAGAADPRYVGGVIVRAVANEAPS